MHETTPQAAKYLQFISLLGDKDIPRSLLPPGNDELEVDEAIGTLKVYAFITHKGEDSFSIHRLVRLAMWNWLQEEGRLKETITSVVCRLAVAFPFPKHENRRRVWIQYLLHTQVTSVSRICTDKTAEAKLLCQVARSYSHLAKFKESEQIYRRALALSEKILGQDHPSTLSSLNNLGVVLNSQGKYEEAEQRHRQALAVKERILGQNYPSTLGSVGNLGIVLESQGKYEEAEQRHRQALALREKVLGPDHPSTIRSRNNLKLYVQK